MAYPPSEDTMWTDAHISYTQASRLQAGTQGLSTQVWILVHTVDSHVPAMPRSHERRPHKPRDPRKHLLSFSACEDTLSPETGQQSPQPFQDLLQQATQAPLQDMEPSGHSPSPALSKSRGPLTASSPVSLQDPSQAIPGCSGSHSRLGPSSHSAGAPGTASRIWHRQSAEGKEGVDRQRQGSTRDPRRQGKGMRLTAPVWVL